MSKNKTLQERLEEAKASSPANGMSPQSIAVTVSNKLKKGVPTGKPTKGSFQKGHTLNVGRSGKDTWGKTRKQRAAEMTEEERRAYFGVIDEHTEKTKAKMSRSAYKAWEDPERKRRQSERLKGVAKPRFHCEHCGKTIGGHSNFVRYGHSEGKCKGAV